MKAPPILRPRLMIRSPRSRLAVWLALVFSPAAWPHRVWVTQDGRREARFILWPRYTVRREQ